MTRRRDKAIKRAANVHKRPSDPLLRFVRPCPHCGGEGPHLIPASFGTPNMWTCDIPADPSHTEPKGDDDDR